MQIITKSTALIDQAYAPNELVTRYGKPGVRHPNVLFSKQYWVHKIGPIAVYQLVRVLSFSIDIHLLIQIPQGDAPAFLILSGEKDGEYRHFMCVW